MRTSVWHYSQSEKPHTNTFLTTGFIPAKGIIPLTRTVPPILSLKNSCLRTFFLSSENNTHNLKTVSFLVIHIYFLSFYVTSKITVSQLNQRKDWFIFTFAFIFWFDSAWYTIRKNIFCIKNSLQFVFTVAGGSGGMGEGAMVITEQRRETSYKT